MTGSTPAGADRTRSPHLERDLRERSQLIDKRGDLIDDLLVDQSSLRVDALTGFADRDALVVDTGARCRQRLAQFGLRPDPTVRRGRGARCLPARPTPRG